MVYLMHGVRNTTLNWSWCDVWYMNNIERWYTVSRMVLLSLNWLSCHRRWNERTFNKLR